MMSPEKITGAKVFMTIKTYPNLSNKYGELVCTAGVCGNRFVRIYPIKFRDLAHFEQFRKYQWIQLDLVKRPRDKDFRLESYSPAPGRKLRLLEHVGGRGRDCWRKRMEILGKVPLHRNLEELIGLARKEPFPSLAMLKPEKILEFVIEPAPREWTDRQKSYFRQPDLFEETRPLTLKKVPYKYSYRFTTEDGKERTMMIEDWETGALYWNCLKGCDGDEEAANAKVRAKYEAIAANPGVFFFIGTTLANHLRSPNPFIIIGVASPNIDISLRQGDLFPSS